MLQQPLFRADLGASCTGDGMQRYTRFALMLLSRFSGVGVDTIKYGCNHASTWNKTSTKFFLFRGYVKAILQGNRLCMNEASRKYLILMTSLRRLSWT